VLLLLPQPGINCQLLTQNNCYCKICKHTMHTCTHDTHKRHPLTRNTPLHTHTLTHTHTRHLHVTHTRIHTLAGGGSEKGAGTVAAAKNIAGLEAGALLRVPRRQLVLQVYSADGGWVRQAWVCCFRKVCGSC
jgi:hypothetical protein